MAVTDAKIDWHSWLRRWDAQQTGYLPDREARFSAMLDVLDVLLPESFVCLDLCAGPGSISQRLLTRFPNARSVALDVDPVLLALGHGALGTMGSRLRWVDADLTSPDWTSALGETELDAVLSTTALHWLPTEHLVRVYRELGQRVRPGGVFLNGDNMPFAPLLPSFQRVADAVKERRESRPFSEYGAENWQDWWAALEAEPAAAPLFAERRRRFGWRNGIGVRAGYDFQVAALQEAGFREVGAIWQRMDNRILLAVK